MSHVKMMQKGAFMRGTDKMIVKEIPVPEIGDKEVLVSLEYVGICGSDVHYYHNGCCGAYKVDLSQDYMLGHECAGTIAKIGKDVTSLKVGDKVALEPGITCGKCEFCNLAIIIYVRMWFFLQRHQYRDVMKNIWHFLRICALSFLITFLQRKAH